MSQPSSGSESPLEKLRALPEKQRNMISVGAAAFIAVSVGFAQVSYRMNEDNASSKVAQNAPSAFEGLGNILEQGKGLMTGAVSNFKGLETSMGTETTNVLNSFSNDRSSTGTVASTSLPLISIPIHVAPKKSIDITQ